MNFTKLREFMDYLVSWRMPGNGVSVWLRGEEVFRYESGFADIESNTKMSDKHLMHIYSCSKIATVTAAMQLFERAKFLLDTPLYDFIPEFRDMYIQDSDGNIKKSENHITIRHLFTMTAGMTYSFPDELKEEARNITNAGFDTLEVIKLMAKMPLSFEPGTRWQYSFCHDVLAAVVEVISGKKFRDYMRENIFLPLGMNDTCYNLTPEAQAKTATLYKFVSDNESDNAQNNVGGYTQSVDMSKFGGHLERTPGCQHLFFGTEFDSGGAGITTSVPDYAKFMNALANGGLGATGERILSPASVNLLKQNQLTEEQAKTLNWPQLAGYGYGLGVRTMMNPAVGGSLSPVGEFGWGGAAGASAFIDTDMQLGVFYAHHMLNQQETYYQPRLRNVIYSCLD